MNPAVLDSGCRIPEMAIRIGPAGSDGLGCMQALSRLARMKLDCMEVAFTYGVRMKPAAA
jgi:hypothetical protein